MSDLAVCSDCGEEVLAGDLIECSGCGSECCGNCAVGEFCSDCDISMDFEDDDFPEDDEEEL